MNKKNTVAAIDVGSTKVSVTVGDIGDRGEMRILGVGVSPASGLSRGVIDNIQSARDSISEAVRRAEQSCGMRILSAVVGLDGTHVSSQNNRGIVAIPDRERPISADDRARVLDAAGQISIPTNREIVHILPRGYWVEGTDPVSDPVGMFGTRLDAETHIITAAVSALQNLAKCVEGAGVQVDDIVFGPVAAADAVLKDEERQQGVALVDIGGSTTSLAVFDEGTVAHTACLPVAGTQLTHDLARVLRCPWESAERLKCESGSAIGDPSLAEESVEIQAFGAHSEKTVSVLHVSEILQARCEEILEMVAAELKRAGYLDKVAAGLVLTGGTSCLPKLAELAEERLGIPARIGMPGGVSGLTELVSTPAYATAAGLVSYSLRGGGKKRESFGTDYEESGHGLFRRLATFGKALMPQ